MNILNSCLEIFNNFEGFKNSKSKKQSRKSSSSSVVPRSKSSSRSPTRPPQRWRSKPNVIESKPSPTVKTVSPGNGQGCCGQRSCYDYNDYDGYDDYYDYPLYPDYPPVINNIMLIPRPQQPQFVTQPTVEITQKQITPPTKQHTPINTEPHPVKSNELFTQGQSPINYLIIILLIIIFILIAIILYQKS